MNLRAEKIFPKQFTDMNWLTRIENPLKISIGSPLKDSARFVPEFAVTNSQISMNRRNLPKSRPGPLILLLVSTIMTSSTNVFGRKRTNAAR